MGLGDLLAKVEKGIARLVVGKQREPLSIQKQILDEIETKTEPTGRSGRTFPYNSLDVFLLATSDTERARLEAIFVERGRLENMVIDRLRRIGSDMPARLRVNVLVVQERSDDWREELFHIEYRRTSEARAPIADESVGGTASAGLVNARLVVVRGKANQSEFAMNKSRINIGRNAEILDRDKRVIRRNDIVFAEGEDPINQTVSRAHAHIIFDEASGQFRLFDDQSSYGTRIFRDEANIEVQSANPRGNRLRAGDEIYFGQACVRFIIKDKTGLETQPVSPK